MAETQVFTDTVRVVMGSRESQDEVRVYATQEAKRRVLDKVGVYLSGSTEIVRRVEESFGVGGRVSVPVVKRSGQEGDGYGDPSSLGAFSDTTTVLQRIQTLTVGVVQTEVASEEWKTEGGAFVLYLVCRVTVDKDDALKRLTELLQDKQKVEDYQKVQEEVERLRGELAQLRTDLESAKSEKETKAVKEEVQEKINGLTAQDWFEKGLAATEPDDKIACYSLVIQLSPNTPVAFNNRGGAYHDKGDFDRAIADLDRALQIDPNFVPAYNNRGGAYAKKSEYDRAIADFDHALQLDPNFAPAYNNRGGAYIEKDDYDRAIADLDRALQLDPNIATAYNLRGFAYFAKVDFDRAIADFNRTLQIDSTFAQAYYIRGIVYGMKDDKVNARSDLQRAVDLGYDAAKRELEKLK